MALKKKLRQLLHTAFPGGRADLAEFENDRVGGTLVWDGFDGQPQIDRQVRLREVIDKLPIHEQLKVSFILTVTSDEMSVMTTP